MKKSPNHNSPEHGHDHFAEMVRWQDAGKQALKGLRDFPGNQRALTESLRGAQFVHGTRKTLVPDIMKRAQSGDLFIATTTSDDQYEQIARHQFINPSSVPSEDSSGIYRYEANSRVGILVLRPSHDFTPEERAAVLAHELAHDEFASKGLYDKDGRFTIGSTPISALLADEASAYLAEAAVLEFELGGEYTQLEQEVLDKLWQHFNSGGRPIDMGLEGARALDLSSNSPAALETAQVIGHIKLAEEGIIPVSLLEDHFARS